MIAPICCECGKEMVCIKNDTLVYHPTQKADGTEWSEKEYRKIDVIDAIWHGDMYECPGCKKKIVAGFGHTILGMDATERLKKKVIKEGVKILR